MTTSALSELLTKSSLSESSPVDIPLSSNKKQHLLSPDLASPPDSDMMTDTSILASSAPDPDKQKGADFLLSSTALQSSSSRRKSKSSGVCDDFHHRPVGEILNVACGTYTSGVVATTKDRPLRGLRDRNVAGLNNELFRKKYVLTPCVLCVIFTRG